MIKLYGFELNGLAEALRATEYQRDLKDSERERSGGTVSAYPHCHDSTASLLEDSVALGGTSFDRNIFK